MLSKPGGATATHIRPTRYPVYVDRQGRRRRRQLDCNGPCLQCREYVAEYNRDAEFQSIGVKGLRLVLTERGLPLGRNQGEDVATLQRCADFAPRLAHEKAYAHELMAKEGHICLFGVKYHAELAPIERFWMWLKQKIRNYLDGTLPKLKHLIDQYYGQYTVFDARRAARHCRETLQAYEMLAQAGADMDLTDLHKQEEKVYASHRRVFDTLTDTLKLAADMPVSAAAEKKAEIMKTREEHKVVREKKIAKNQEDIAAMFRRQKRAQRSDEEVKADKEASKKRKQQRKEAVGQNAQSS